MLPNQSIAEYVVIRFVVVYILEQIDTLVPRVSASF